MAFMKTNTVDITVGGTTYNSLTNFGLAIKNTDYIGTPVRDEHITFVPGRDGPVDFTDEVFGGPSFNYRTIEIEFGGVQEPEDWDAWISTFRNLFEGKNIKLEFATDPGWYYSGRASIEDFEHNRALGVFALVIERAYPYKRKDVSLTITATAAGATVSAVVTRQKAVPEVTCENNIVICGPDMFPHPPYDGQKTTQGITFTPNSDGSITASGTATGTAIYYIKAQSQTIDTIPGESYVLSGCISGGSSSTYKVDVVYTGSGSVPDYGNGVTFTMPTDGRTIRQGRIVIYSGVTMNDEIFRPFLYKSGEEKSFDAGTHKNLEFQLAAGTNSLLVKGSGAVTIAYKDGSL